MSLSLFSSRLSCLHRLAWKAVTVASCIRHHNHSSLIAELIENMDKKATWDRFYTENGSATATFKNFEWFFGFDAIRGFILPVLQSQAQSQSKSQSDALLRVLDLGCGTSAVGPGIYEHSPVAVHVTCADISPVAVRLMREQHAQKNPEPQNPRSRLDFLELDGAELHAHYGPQGRLDLIVDKGTIDALLRSREGRGKAGRVLAQCLGALRGGSGSLLQFSDEDPDARLPWLETEGRRGEEGRPAVTVTVHDVGELRGMCYYCYQVTPTDPTAGS